MLGNFDLSTALDEILDGGMRAWARGLVVNHKGKAYGIYFVRYKSTLPENKDGRWNAVAIPLLLLLLL